MEALFLTDGNSSPPFEICPFGEQILLLEKLLENSHWKFAGFTPKFPKWNVSPVTEKFT